MTAAAVVTKRLASKSLAASFNRGRIVTQHVLFIVTNAAVIGPHNRKTGFFFAEVAHPFDALDRAGIAIEFASPAGGWPPYDAYDENDPAQKGFLESKAFRR